MSRRCGSSKPTPTPLTVWLWSQEHAKKSSRKKHRPYNKAIITHQKPAACCRILCCRSHCTAAKPPTLLLPIHHVASQRPRPGNDAFFKGIVACMVSAPRVDFSSALATAVVETNCALLPSERPASRQLPPPRSTGHYRRQLGSPRGRLSQRYHIHVGSPWWYPALALPTPSSAQSRGATRVPCSRVTRYRAMCGSVCPFLSFMCCICSTLFFFIRNPLWFHAQVRVLPSTPHVKLKVGDTECPLQVCQLSRSSESTHFRSFVEMQLYSFPPEPGIASEIGGTCLRSTS